MTTAIEHTVGFETGSRAPLSVFHARFYERHNRRRQEHLASLRLDLANASVLEVGAGIGDHTEFFLDRGCRVLTTEVRPENLRLLVARFSSDEYPNVEIKQLDLDRPDPDFTGEFDIVYCYGLLYHLHRPAEAIEFMAAHCWRLLLLETRVSFGDDDAFRPCPEIAANPSHSVHGQGCRPTRKWVFGQLGRHFEHVYITRTQPWHEEFPADWTCPPPEDRRVRSVFVASRQALNNDMLVTDIPRTQTRL